MNESKITLFTIIDNIYKLDLLETAKDIEKLISYLLDNKVLQDEKELIYMPNTNTADVYIKYNYEVKKRLIPKLLKYLVTYFLELWHYPKNIFSNELNLAFNNRIEGLKLNPDNYIALDTYIDFDYTSDEVSKLIIFIDTITMIIVPYDSMYEFEEAYFNKYTGARLYRNYFEFLDFYLKEIIYSENISPLKDTNLDTNKKIEALNDSVLLIKKHIDIFKIEKDLKNIFESFLNEIIEDKINRIAAIKDRYYYRENIFKGLKKIDGNYIIKYEDITFYPVVVDMIISYFELLICFRNLKSISRHHRKSMPKNLIEFHKVIKEQQLKPYLINCFNIYLENDFKETKEFMKKIYYLDPSMHKKTPLYEKLPNEIIKILKYSKEIL